MELWLSRGDDFLRGSLFFGSKKILTFPEFPERS